MDIKYKTKLYLREIASGRFGIENNFIVYRKVDRCAKNRGVKIGDIIGRKRPDANSWQCYACIDGKSIIIAMSIVMYAYHYGIENIYEKMEIRYKDGNRYNFSKENMIDSSDRFGITDDELVNNTCKRIELVLNQIKAGLYYVNEENGQIYYNATGNNVEKGDVLGCLDDMGYISHMINIRGAKEGNLRVRLHEVLYAYYYGLENFDENKVIHHKNGDKLDNRRENLEQVSHYHNGRIAQMNDVDKINKYLSSREKVEFILNRIEEGVYEFEIDTGKMNYARRIPHTKIKIGQPVGSISNKGYRIVSFKYNKVCYNVSLHVVNYYYIHGIENFDENAVIDHIDGDKLNNSIKNLQKVSHRNNSKKGNRPCE